MIEMIAPEQSWFGDGAGNIIGAVLWDRSDNDWNYVILGSDGIGSFRWIDGDSSFKTQGEAETAIIAAMSHIEKTGKASEELFADSTIAPAGEAQVVFCGINDELKRYFSEHPERLYDLTSRKFEELIADILGDYGFEVELTRATHDGGRDIIAYLRNAVASYLTFVECKKYAPTRKVGVEVVREVAGVHHINKAAKSLIVTTSFFTKGAIEEARKIEHQLELKDYDELKAWLARYS